MCTYGHIDYRTAKLFLFTLTKEIQKSVLEEDSFDSSESQYDTDKETEDKISFKADEKTEESKGQSFKKWATEQLGIKLRDNQNKSTIDESNILKATNLRLNKKDIERKVLIQDRTDIIVESITDNEKTNVKDSGETEAVKKVSCF